MSEMYEAAVALYLTRGGEVFISQQYNAEWDKVRQEGGSTPDIIALDFVRHELIVVEVSASATWQKLRKRVSERTSRWYRPISRELQRIDAIDNGWKVRFLGFIRGVLVPGANAAFSSESDVEFTALEAAVHMWEYWEDRKLSIPGAGTGVELSPID